MSHLAPFLRNPARLSSWSRKILDGFAKADGGYWIVAFGLLVVLAFPQRLASAGTYFFTDAGHLIEAALMGGALLCLVRVSLREMATAACLSVGVFLASSQVATLENPVAFAFNLGCGSFFAIAFALQMRRLLNDARRGDWSRARYLVLSAALVGGVWDLGGALQIVSLAGPTFDGALFNFDQHLGLRFPTLVFMLLNQSRVLSDMVYLSYIGVPAIIAMFDVANSKDERSAPMTIRFLASAALGFAIYYCVPAAGPLQSLTDYLAHWSSTSALLTAPTLNVPGGMARNCIPSLHSTWAYFVMMNAWRLDSRLLRVCFRALGVLIVLGALTTGGHWFIDIVIAAPFAFSLNVIFDGRVSDAGAAALAALVSLAWFVAIRELTFVDTTPLQAWALIVATMASPWIAKAFAGQLVSRRLASAPTLPA